MQLPTTNAVWPIAQLLDPDFKKRVPDCEIYQLDNGMRVVIMTDPKDRSSFFKVTVNAGALHQRTDIRGIAHFTEHMLFQGTERFKDNRAIQEHVEDFNLSFNAATSTDFQHFWVESDNDDESVNEAMIHLSQVVMHPTLPKDKVEKEKQVVTAERQSSLSDPDYFNVDVAMKHFYSDTHPLGGGWTPGEVKDIEKFTHQHVQDFYQDFFTPANMVMVVAGGRKISDYKKLIAKYFDIGPKQKQAEWVLNPILHATRDTKAYDQDVEKDFNHISLEAGLYFTATEVPMYSLDHLALRFATSVLATRVFLDVREQQGLAYSTGATLGNLYHGLFFSLYGEFAKPKYKKGKKELLKYADNLVKKPIEMAEYKRAMRRFKSIRWANSARSIAGSVSNWLFESGQLVSPEGLHKYYDQLTLEFVNDHIAQLLKDRPLEVIAVGPISK